MTRITQSDVTANPGDYTVSQWLIAHNIQGPDYESCSAYQYHRMSHAARRRRDAQVAAAQAEEQAGRMAYRDAIIHEHEHNPAFVARTSDAQRIIRDHLAARQKEQERAQFLASWRVEPGAVSVGDIVEYRAGGTFRVIKVNRKTIRVITSWEQEAILPFGSFRMATA